MLIVFKMKDKTYACYTVSFKPKVMQLNVILSEAKNGRRTAYKNSKINTTLRNG